MRSSRVCLGVLLSLLGTRPVLADTVTIDFETFLNGDSFPDVTFPNYYALTDEFRALGIVFEPTTNVAVDLGLGPTSGTHAVYTGNPTTDDVTLDASFVLPGTSNAALVPWFEWRQDLNLATGPNTATAYGIDGSVLETFEFNSAGGTFRLEAPAGQPLIYRVFIRGNDGIDDVAFDRGALAAVPEPATAALVAAALIVLGVHRRRRAAMDR